MTTTTTAAPASVTPATSNYNYSGECSLPPEIGYGCDNIAIVDATVTEVAKTTKIAIAANKRLEASVLLSLSSSFQSKFGGWNDGRGGDDCASF